MKHTNWWNTNRWSTTHQKTFNNTCITRCCNNNIWQHKWLQFTALLLLDLKKAFDTVNYNILLEKLDHYDIREVAHNLFSSFSSNRLNMFHLIIYNWLRSILAVVYLKGLFLALYFLQFISMIFVMLLLQAQDHLQMTLA